MAKQYAPNATFDDPIYSLRGQTDIGHMWTSLSWSKWAKQAFPLGGLVDVKPVKSLLLRALHAI